MLTYETIRKIVNDEKESTTKLTKIPDNFFIQARMYLDNKSKMGGETRELESAKRRLQDILDLREKKILTLALYSVRTNTEPENLTPREKELFDKIVETIKKFHSKAEKTMDREGGDAIIAMLQDLEEFVGIDMKNYGPFKEGDISSVPKANAELLMKKNVAIGIEVK